VNEYKHIEYSKANSYTVDSHALQHPEIHGKKNNFFHLLRLGYIFIYKGESGINKDPKVLKKRINGNIDIPILIPPVTRGKINVNILEKAENPDEYFKLAQEWALEVWNSWSSYHDVIENELKTIFKKKF
jgi:hypothetical protein